MKRNPVLVFVVLLAVFGVLFGWVTSFSFFDFLGSGEASPRVSSKNSILHLKLEGVIVQPRRFLKQLDKYSKDPKIKAILIEINSPGGVVGPSQEIFAEVKRVREELKKPVVAVSNGLLASGAYYAAIAADKIVVAPGTLMGSIGVIMEFANLEKLYEWAKVSRFSITTGKYKDSGSEYRSMREDERALFQDLANEVYGQFKQAVAESRGLEDAFVSQYADGRVFTGSQGVKLKFADAVGTVRDATRMAAELANLKADEWEVFEVPKFRPSPMDFLFGGISDEEEAESSVAQALHTVLRTQLLNRPLMILPGFFEK